jgi:hypothetical protein
LQFDSKFGKNKAAQIQKAIKENIRDPAFSDAIQEEEKS